MATTPQGRPDRLNPTRPEPAPLDLKPADPAAFGRFADATKRQWEFAAEDARKHFDRRIADELLPLCRIVPPGPEFRTVAGAIDAPSPLLVAENASLPGITRYDDQDRSLLTHVVGGELSESIPAASKWSPDTIRDTFQGVADHIADGLIEHVVSALEAISWGSSQAEASALSVASFGDAVIKLRALTTPNGANAPRARRLVVAEDLAADVASLWSQGIAGITISVCPLLPSGRWFLLPQRSSIGLVASTQMHVDVSTAHSAVPAIRLRAWVGLAETLDLETADDAATPRWVVKGGA